MEGHSRDAGALAHLLKASSKAALERIVNVVFCSRHEQPQLSADLIQTSLQITADEALQTQRALKALTELCVYISSESGVEQMLASAGVNLDARLRDLLKQLIAARLPDWKAAAALNRVSLPTLMEVDWRLDVKRASSELARMELPSVLVDLQVRDQPTNALALPGVKHVTFELTKETLDTMLDGLGRIREQLNKVSGAS